MAGPRPHNKVNHRGIEAAERARQALELRKSGLGFQAIADRLGYKDHSGAHRAVSSALKRTLQEPADDVRKLEIERLDAMLHAIWPQIEKGDQFAIDRGLKIMARRAAYLGLDAPAKKEITGELILHGLAERAAKHYGLDPAQVMAEAERILAEVAN